MANVTRRAVARPAHQRDVALPRDDSYSRGPQMLELTWERALSRPQVELIAAQVSKLQECFD